MQNVESANFAPTSIEKVLVGMGLRLVELVAQLPTFEDKRTERVRQLIGEGGEKIAAGLFDDGIRCFEEAIRIKPKSFGAYLAMIDGYRKSGKDLEAISWGGFALSHAKSNTERGLVYILMGSTALDTFRLSGFPGHADQSLAFYRQALNENPTDLRPVWNAIETHLEVIVREVSNEISEADHKEEMKRKLSYLIATLEKTPNSTLVAKFVIEGEKMERRLKENKLTLSEFSEGFLALKKIANRGNSVQEMSRLHGGEVEEENGANKKKILAYVLASFLLASGAVFSILNDAEGADQGVPHHYEEVLPGGSTSEKTEALHSDRGAQTENVFALSNDNNLEVATVDPDWEEMKKFATVDPDWEEMKKYA